MNRITSIIVDNMFDDWKTGKEPPQEGEVILLYDPLFHTLRCAKYDNQILMAEQRWINLMVFLTSLLDILKRVCLTLPISNPINSTLNSRVHKQQNDYDTDNKSR